MARVRRTFTPEFKRDAVALVTREGKAASEVARNLGIARSLLQRWIESGVSRRAAPKLERLQVEPQEAYLSAAEKSLQLSVEAHFNDGTRRDVRELAVYEPSSNKASVSARPITEGTAEERARAGLRVPVGPVPRTGRSAVGSVPGR